MGQDFDFNHENCERKCEALSGCVAYTQFATWYHDSEFYASCMGRSNNYDIMEPDDAVKSGVMLFVPPGKYCYYPYLMQLFFLVCMHILCKVILMWKLKISINMSYMFISLYMESFIMYAFALH